MHLQTVRIYTREYTIQDLPEYFDLKSCSQVWKYSTFYPSQNLIIAEKLLIEHIKNCCEIGFGFQPLFKKSDHQFLGEAGILSYNRANNRCDIGYNLLPQYWGYGYATEICREIISYAFTELGMERVEALVMEENIASFRVLGKSGLQKEGTLRHFSKDGDRYRNVNYYGMIKEDWSIVVDALNSSL